MYADTGDVKVSVGVAKPAPVVANDSDWSALSLLRLLSAKVFTSAIRGITEEFAMGKKKSQLDG